ncbi:histidine phosphatase family protein [Brachymonas chironomi]|uniref:histidine phosphatase family protein n=1 Tax=Brachymonas chironomi TaxID=491919 RepID=UPI0003659367|nr:histidine phosphatase family protein [Brachymonas chironomi]
MTRLPEQPWWLLRHATPLVDAGICYGQLDVPADAAATRRSAHAFLAALPALSQPLHIVSSPARRCRQLALALQQQAEQAGMATLPRVDTRLQEMHFGSWEGRPWSALPAREWEHWMADFGGWHAGGHGESLHDFMARVQAAARQHQSLASAPPTVWVTHAGVMRIMHLWQHGVLRVHHAHDWPRQGATDPGGWLRIGQPAAGI